MKSRRQSAIAANCIAGKIGIKYRISNAVREQRKIVLEMTIKSTAAHKILYILELVNTTHNSNKKK